MTSRCLCAKVVQQYFPEFLFLWFLDPGICFRPRDMQEYIFMFSIALEWTVNSICNHQISSWCREIFKYNTVIWVSRIVYKQVHSA
jgi:hypothetical protein